MSEENNAHSEIKAIDVKAAHADAHHKKGGDHAVSSGHTELNKQNIDNSDNITTEQAAAARQGLLNRQYNEMENVVSPEQQMAEAQRAQTEQQIAQVKAQIAQLAAAREEQVPKLQKPTTNVATTGAVVGVLGAGIAKIAQMAGDAKGAADNLVKDIAQKFVTDPNFNDVAAEVGNKFGNVKSIRVADLQDLQVTVKSAINKQTASLINKDGVVKAVEEVGKNLEQVNEKVRPTFLKKTGDIANKIIDANKVSGANKEAIVQATQNINKAVEGGFLQGGFAGLGAKIPDGLDEVVNGAKTSVNEIANKRNNLLNGDHVEQLETAFRAKMSDNIIGKTAINIFEKVDGIPVNNYILAGGAILVTAGLVAGAHHLATSKERKEKEEAKEAVGKYSEAILRGQQAVAELSMAGGGRGQG